VNLFFDTSALVKLFHEEEGSAETIALVEPKEVIIRVSALARLEFVSSIWRKIRNYELDEASGLASVREFEQAWLTFRIEPLGAGVLEEAEDMIRQHGKTVALRTLDALHLATFALIAEEDWKFVLADGAFAKAARAMGFSVVNPLDAGGKGP